MLSQILAFFVTGTLFMLVVVHALTYGRRGRRWGQLPDSRAQQQD